MKSEAKITLEVGTGGTHGDRETLFLEPFVTELDINLVQEYRN